MNFLNFNFLHNLINLAIVVLGALLVGSGCLAAATGALDCSASWLPPSFTAWSITILAALKIGMNILRDGVFGLTKVQPPVQK